MRLPPAREPPVASRNHFRYCSIDGELHHETTILAARSRPLLGDAGVFALTCRAIAAELARGATHARAGAQRLMYGGMTESLETQTENEIRNIYKMAATDDTREAINAFNEKRAPVFKGR